MQRVCGVVWCVDWMVRENEEGGGVGAFGFWLLSHPPFYCTGRYDKLSAEFSRRFP